jgi:hypothetical protein
MAKYRKKPITIEAIQFEDTTDCITELSDFMNNTISIDYSNTKPTLKINTLEGIMTANVGDFIIKGIKGEFYPCKPDIFNNSYELV